MKTPDVEIIENEATGTEVVQLPAGDAMVDLQVATGKRYPRSVSKFRKEAEALAVLDAETAGECVYTLPRGGKTIEGPSVRFAEILLHAWGNARADAEVIDEGESYITAQGTFFDLERNVAIRKKVRRRITDKHGRRYNDDMITVTGNAANSIALRNAVLAGIPRAVWKGVYTEVRKAIISKGKGTLTQKRDEILKWFGEKGVEPERIFPVLGVDGIEDIKEDQLITLRGLANAIREGEISIDETFPRPGSVDVGRNAELNEALRRKVQPEQCAECGSPFDDGKHQVADADALPGMKLCMTCVAKADDKPKRKGRKP